MAQFCAFQVAIPSLETAVESQQRRDFFPRSLSPKSVARFCRKACHRRIQLPAREQSLSEYGHDRSPAAAVSPAPLVVIEHSSTATLQAACQCRQRPLSICNIRLHLRSRRLEPGLRGEPMRSPPPTGRWKRRQGRMSSCTNPEQRPTLASPFHPRQMLGAARGTRPHFELNRARSQIVVAPQDFDAPSVVNSNNFENITPAARRPKIGVWAFIK